MKGKVKYVPPRVLRELENIKSNYSLSDARAFDKMADLAPVGMEFEKMRDKFVMADIFKKRKKRGNIQDIGLAMVFIFSAVILFFVVTHGYSSFVDKAVNNTVINSSNATVTSFQETKELTSRLDYVVFALLMGFTLAIIITGYLVGGNPIFAFVYFIGIVLLVITSAIFSYVWNIISTKPIFGTLAADKFPISDFILGNFPLYIAIIGFIGMMVMFAKPREQ